MRHKKKTVIKALAAAAVLCIIVITTVNVLTAQSRNARTTEQMRNFLSTYGWESEANPTETRKIKIPSQFGAAYVRYNDMQKAAGFDLSKYRGKEVIQVTFKITNYESDDDVFANLLIYKDNVIGGDVCSYAIDGFIQPLKSE
jgi:hypothetical protein